jgi:predicted extracellular nuclease
MRRLTARVLALSLVGTGVLAVPSGAVADTSDVRISEIRIDQPGDDDDEFFELSGPAGQSLDGLTYLVIGDGAGGSGVIEEVTKLDGSVIQPDGSFVAAETTFSLGPADLETLLNFENGENVTHMLVSGFFGASSNDLDTDDDGTFDLTPWTSIVDSIALVATPDSGDRYYGDATIGPDGSFVPGHVYRDGEGVWRIGAFGGGDETIHVTDDDPCDAAPTTTIMAIQGTGAASTMVGEVVSTTGVVTGTTGSSVWLQDADGDGDPATSDAIQIHWGDVSDRPYLSDGDIVTFCGTVGEYRGLTQLSDIGRITVEGETEELEPLPFALPAPYDLETYESMLIAVDQTLYATDIYNSIEYDETFFSGNPLWIPTELFAPGSPEAEALALENSRNAFKLALDRDLYDDMMDTAGRFLRWGDAVEMDRVGHLTETFNAKQFRIMGFPFFVQASDVQLLNDRPEGGPVVAPEADTVVASFNVFNYWTSDYYGEYDDCKDDASDVEAECGPEPRGHRGSGQEARQRAAVVDAITALGADVVALQELETPGLGDRNAGDSPNETLIDLVAELNDAEGPGTWDYVPVPDAFLDANTNPIMSGFIYKPARVEATGDMLYLGDLADLYDRLPVAATFRRDGAKFTVVNNHFKSKGCSGATGDDQDSGDGQGCFNATRTQQAEAVIDWVEDDLVKEGRTKRVLVVGDLNAYAMEDPVSVLRDAGLVDLVGEYEAPDTFSYTYFGQAGSLDHAFVTKQMDAKVRSVDVWGINAAESADLNYFGPEPSEARWRSSDHDPVVVGLDLLDD